MSCVRCSADLSTFPNALATSAALSRYLSEVIASGRCMAILLTDDLRIRPFLGQPMLSRQAVRLR
jgi:hypothetical protein